MRMVQSPFVRIIMAPRPTLVVSVRSGLNITPGDSAQDTETQANQHNASHQSHHRSCSFRRVRTRSRKTPSPLGGSKNHAREPWYRKRVIARRTNFLLFPF